VHTLQVTDFLPLSPNSVLFEVTGFYAPTPAASTCVRASSRAHRPARTGRHA
jgi:hypothetical protein